MEEVIFDTKLYKYCKVTPIDFGSLLNTITVQYLKRWDDDTSYDIIMKMFTKLFIEDIDRIVKFYNPDFGLFTYLFTIVKNEIISISVSLGAKSRKCVRPTQISETLKMSEEDVWASLTSEADNSLGGRLSSEDFISNGPSSSETEEYNSLVSDYENMKHKIIKGDIVVQDKEQSLGNIEKKIEKLTVNHQRLSGYHRKRYIDNTQLTLSMSPITPEEAIEQSTSEFVMSIKAKLQNTKTIYRGKEHTPWQGDRLKFIDLIMADFSLTECATFFEVSPTSTSKWSNQIKTALLELADEREFDEDDDSLVLSVNQWLDDLEAEDRVNNSRSEGCPLVDKVQLYKQIISIFGVDFVKLES